MVKVYTNKDIRIVIELELEESKNILADLNKFKNDFKTEDSLMFYDELNEVTNENDED